MCFHVRFHVLSCAFMCFHVQYQKGVVRKYETVGCSMELKIPAYPNNNEKVAQLFVQVSVEVPKQS